MPKTKTITGFFVDPENCIAEPRTIEKSLDGYYALLRCTTIDITSRVIGGEAFDIICDDGALLVDNPCPSALDRVHNVALCGPIFVVNYNGKDDVADLSNWDVYLLSRLVRRYWRGNKLCTILTSLAY